MTFSIDQVLATGLSALYSSLPTNVQLTEDDWHSPLSQFELVVPELKKFLQTLSYCNSVLQVSSTYSLCVHLYCIDGSITGMPSSGFTNKEWISSASCWSCYITGLWP